MYMHKVISYWHWYLLDMYVEKPIIWHSEASWPDQWQIVAPWWDPVVMSLQSCTGHELNWSSLEWLKVLTRVTTWNKSRNLAFRNSSLQLNGVFVNKMWLILNMNSKLGCIFSSFVFQHFLALYITRSSSWSWWGRTLLYNWLAVVGCFVVFLRICLTLPSS